MTGLLKSRVTNPCTGAGLARFHEWKINFPGPVTGNVIGQRTCAAFCYSRFSASQFNNVARNPSQPVQSSILMTFKAHGLLRPLPWMVHQSLKRSPRNCGGPSKMIKHLSFNSTTMARLTSASFASTPTLNQFRFNLMHQRTKFRNRQWTLTSLTLTQL